MLRGAIKPPLPPLTELSPSMGSMLKGAGTFTCSGICGIGKAAYDVLQGQMEACTVTDEEGGHKGCAASANICIWSVVM